MVKNFINFTNQNLKKIGNFKNQYIAFTKTYQNIDFRLLNKTEKHNRISFARLKLIGILIKSLF